MSVLDISKAIRIDPNYEELYGWGECFVVYPSRFPTVTFILFDTDELNAVADDIRKQYGYEPLYDKDHLTNDWYEFYVGINGYSEHIVDTVIRFTVCGASGLDCEGTYAIELDIPQQKELYGILNSQCETLYGMTCEELIKKAEEMFG